MNKSMPVTHRTVQGSKEMLRRDLRRIVEDADNLMNEMTNANCSFRRGLA